jgi:hypothetical protein
VIERDKFPNNSAIVAVNLSFHRILGAFDWSFHSFRARLCEDLRVMAIEISVHRNKFQFAIAQFRDFTARFSRNARSSMMTDEDPKGYKQEISVD